MTQQFWPLGLIPLLPLGGVLFALFGGRRGGRRAVNVVAPGVVGLAFAVSVWSLARLVSLPAGGALRFAAWRWIAAGPFHVEMALRFDALTAIMCLVVTGVGALIHVYSVGYMGHDEDYARFFTYMNLFTASMLILVLADNLVVMFVGWEGVGLCSYLLIAFWYTNPEYAYNGRKAFIVNRVGDAGFLLGIFTIVYALARGGVWTVTFAGMSHQAALLQPYATAAALLLFLGATGKSAQIPLYVWLPDAMVGPTPVSALIHAATMVTAGVYMVTRLGFLFTLAPAALTVVAVVGAVTAFFAATIAMVQTDIKRVLAYSTISQIGYMMLGAGVGAFSAGIFHLMTHAFFKALLFLCAGAIIHELDGEQEMGRMGGLRGSMPITWLTMLTAALAISGIPPFAGYFSKDQILEATFASGHPTLWLIGVITAGLTAFYIFRLIILTFYGESRVEPSKAAHLHDAPAVMTVPLIVLALLSVGGGWVGLPRGFLWGEAFNRFLAPVVIPPGAELATPGSGLALVMIAIPIVGVAAAVVCYAQMPGLPVLVAYKARLLDSLLRHKYYVDELYNAVIARPLFWVAAYVLHRGVDGAVIDGLVNGTGLTLLEGGEELRRTESGNVQHYALLYLCGALGIGAYYLYRVVIR
ncbi:MAG TPA: NADH-quinone oxidoreductase subunit L [Candidatus Binataceae bacterium]|nr:NADH-quinone oxidoreductase subunit L [Candidatus Binataceae bacterium]